MYAHVSHWKFQPGRAGEVLHLFEQQALPILRQESGFHSYEAILTAPDHALAISRWESEAGVAAARALVPEWVARAGGEQVVSVHTTADVVCPIVSAVGQ
jgi:quinol monooxygenase YgiN